MSVTLSHLHVLRRNVNDQPLLVFAGETIVLEQVPLGQDNLVVLASRVLLSDDERTRVRPAGDIIEGAVEEGTPIPV